MIFYLSNCKNLLEYRCLVIKEIVDFSNSNFILEIFFLNIKGLKFIF